MGAGELPEVLVVEDDPDLNDVISAYVDLAGCRCRSALDGSSALREIDARAPALVLLDLMLPDIDGFEVLRIVRADANRRDVPVVVVSGLKDEVAVERARAYGVKEYVNKPFDPDDLIAIIRRTVNGAAPPAARGPREGR